MSFRWLRQCSEIPVLLLFFSFMVCDSVNTNFTIYRTCYVTLGYDQTDCAKLGSANADNNTKELEKLVEPYANEIGMTQALSTQILPALLCLFIGPWSDKHGRKPVLISTLIGYTLGGVITIIVVLISFLSPWYLLLGSIPAVIFGGFPPFLMAILCYITDITTEENRGMRIGIFEGILALGALLGTLSSSYIFAFGGYIAVYGIGMACHVLSLLYIIFVLKETVPNSSNQDDSSIFTLKNISDMLKTTFKARESYTRSILLLTIGIATIFILASVADSSVFFMFLREKLGWSLEKYTLYKSIRDLLWIVGTFVGLTLLHKLLKIQESPLLLLGFSAYFTGILLQGFATEDWHIYLAGGIRCISGVISPMCRSLISKLVPSEESGKVFSITITLESLTVMIGAPLYTSVYNATINTFPGAFNFLTAGMFGVEILLTITVIFIQKALLDVNAYRSLSINLEE